MDDDRTAYLAAIKETCHRQVEDEIQRIKEQYEDEARIVKKQYENDVQKLKIRYEERIKTCQEDLQREYSILLNKELETQRRELQREHEERIETLTEETKKLQESLAEEARNTKKNYQRTVKKQLKVRYEELIRQIEENLQREYNGLFMEQLEIREMELISEYEERLKAVTVEKQKNETELQLQLTKMEQKCDDTLAKLDQHWNHQVSDLLKMLTMQAEEKILLDVTGLHEKFMNIVKEKDEALISTINVDKSNSISEYESLLQEYKQQGLENSALKSKVKELRSALRHAESSFTEKQSAYDQDRERWVLNAKDMQADILRLQNALEAEAHRRSTKKAHFQASQEQWSKERNELAQANDELTRKYTMNDRSKSEEILLLKRDLQQARDEQETTESKLKSLQKQRGVLKVDIDRISTQCQQQADAMVSLQREHERDILNLQARQSDLLRDYDKTWEDRCEKLKNETHILRKESECAVREKEDAITKATMLEKKLMNMHDRSLIDLSNKEQELSAAKDNYQIVSSKLLNAQEENVRLKEMIGQMRKDMDLMISLKPQEMASATSDGKLEDVLCNVLTTVRDKLNWSEKATCSIQLDKLVGSVDDLKSSVIAMSTSQSKEHEKRYEHLYSEFVIILDERNRLVEISNQLQAEIKQMKHKSGGINAEEASSVECDPVLEDSDAQNLARTLWTNAVRVLPSASALPPRSTDRVTESQRKVRKRLQRERMKKMTAKSLPSDINVRNWNKKDD